MKEEYKQTEIGFIPEDWDATTLGNVAEVIMGQSPKGTSYNRDGNGLPLINGPTEFTKKYPIKVQWTTEPTKLCKPLDLLLCVRGSSTGRMNIANDEFCIGRGVATIRANHRASTEYLTYQVHLAIEKLLALSAGSTFPSVDSKAINSIPLPCPGAEEQRLIAQALSDVDALIAALDKLIAKKRNLKTATMQQLLTGKKRLLGFGDEWKAKQLGDVCEIISGGTPSTANINFWNGNISWCTPTDITAASGKYLERTARKINEEGLRFSAANLLPVGSILLCTRATIGEMKIAKFPVATNQGFKSLIPQKGTNNEFIYYLMINQKNKLIEKGVGSTFLEISKRDVASLTFNLPLEEEQRMIATVLSEMDTEITALESRLAKTQAIKHGMMQELLTGRTRLE